MARPFDGDHVVDLGVELDLGAERLRGPAEHLGEPAVAALVERPRAELAVVLAHAVEQQHEAASPATSGRPCVPMIDDDDSQPLMMSLSK